jgi:hypothetical protein
MRVLQRHSHSQADHPLQRLACDINQGLEAGVGRYEPHAVRAYRVPTDPYKAWVQQREAASEQADRTRTSWVYRYRGNAATKITR